MKDHSHITDHKTDQAVIDYYRKAFDVVQIVRCNECGSDLCMEVLDPQQNNSATHPEGLRRITLGTALRSSRWRLDGVMGYSCSCGNNTLLAKVEYGKVPSSKTGVPDIAPHEVAAIKLDIAASHYKPDVETNGNKQRIESFTVERLKGTLSRIAY